MQDVFIELPPFERYRQAYFSVAQQQILTSLVQSILEKENE